MPKVTHHIGQISNVEGHTASGEQITSKTIVDMVSCKGDTGRLYMRLQLRNPLFPEHGQEAFLTITQARELQTMLNNWHDDGEPCW